MASNIPEGMGRNRILPRIEDHDLDSILQEDALLGELAFIGRSLFSKPL